MKNSFFFYFFLSFFLFEQKIESRFELIKKNKKTIYSLSALTLLGFGLYKNYKNKQILKAKKKLKNPQNIKEQKELSYKFVIPIENKENNTNILIFNNTDEYNNFYNLTQNPGLKFKEQLGSLDSLNKLNPKNNLNQEEKLEWERIKNKIIEYLKNNNNESNKNEQK